MPDIAMCGDDNCPSRLTCWRFIAPPDSYQSYMLFDRPEDGERCADYWPVAKWRGK